MADSVFDITSIIFNGIVADYLSARRKLMVMGPALWRGQVGFHGVFLADGVVFHFTAGANAHVWLDVRAGRDLLQADLHGFGAFDAFEGEGTWCF
jgi:hypothetical protein